MKKTPHAIFAMLMIIALNSCYSYKWNTNLSGSLQPAPKKIANVFNKHKNGRIEIKAQTPGYAYKYDIGEKDSYYDKSDAFQFDDITITLKDKMPKDMILVDLEFKDILGNTVSLKEVDLLKLIPKMDSDGEMVYPEILEEEYNRFGLSFRREHDEFDLDVNYGAGQEEIENKAYRVGLTNNCLSPTKWEFNITTENYDDFSDRCQSNINLNQNKILAHSWFYLDKELYQALFELKNPGKKVDMNFDMDYNELSNRAETVVIDYNQLRNPIKSKVDIELLEIGHKSGRKIEYLDNEEYYKRNSGLVINEKEQTYSSILDETIYLTKFKDEGFYSETDPKICNWEWLRYVDEIEMNTIDVKGSDAYVEIKLTGEYSPYEITFGNVDLSLIDDQKLYGMLFGVNTYPKSRRYNPVQNTRSYDAELIPDDIKTYLYLTDKKTGKWVNNQYKAVEKIYLTYDDIEGDVLNIYLLSYERIIPVWMGKVELPKNLRETIRIRKKLYN